ncbi:hypothetical protein RISK_004970 [Rhodopirellula islandica]|uniref:Uncharacterized protein n=1 Tax=Rhodopirellula islandica TaxID=595434 RepID=A0A0J1B852_RHOIS|nr:hypothetical protein RISK_004970 [Rhodopirellula islandica]
MAEVTRGFSASVASRVLDESSGEALYHRDIETPFGSAKETGHD